MTVRDVVKGVLVTFVCLVGASARSVDASVCVLGAAMLSLPIGAGIGPLAGTRRRDRALLMLAAMASFLVLPLMVGTLLIDDSTRELQQRLLGVYPWLVIGIAVLVRWTRPPPMPPALPSARLCGFRFSLVRALDRARSLTGIEISTVLWLVSAFAIAQGSNFPHEDTYGRSLEIEWEHTRVFALLATCVLPLGVGVGAVAERLPHARLLLLPLTIGASWYALIFARQVNEIELPSWAIAVMLANAVLVERVTRSRAIL